MKYLLANFHTDKNRCKNQQIPSGIGNGRVFGSCTVIRAPNPLLIPFRFLAFSMNNTISSPRIPKL
jgi:hypothetical protein